MIQLLCLFCSIKVFWNIKKKKVIWSLPNNTIFGITNLKQHELKNFSTNVSPLSPFFFFVDLDFALMQAKSFFFLKPGFFFACFFFVVAHITNHNFSMAENTQRERNYIHRSKFDFIALELLLPTWEHVWNRTWNIQTSCE